MARPVVPEVKRIAAVSSAEESAFQAEEARLGRADWSERWEAKAGSTSTVTSSTVN